MYFRHQGYFALILTLLSLSLAAQEPDKNVVIENKTQTFRFQQVNKGAAAEISQNDETVFRCNNFRTDILFSEMYDSTESIDDINIYVGDNKVKWIRPKYEYYSVESIFYSDARICYFSLPLEKKGSTSRVVLQKTHKDPQYFTSVYFTESHFTEKKTISFIIPRWMKAELKEFNFEGYGIRKIEQYDAAKNEDIITYTVSNLPAAKKEKSSPGGSYIFPHILVLSKEALLEKGKITYFKSLDEQYNWYYTLVKEPVGNKDLLLTKATDITRNAHTDIEKAKAIYAWVQQNIRYIAFEDGIAGFKPAAPADVLNKKYGDCKGMANLVKNLLQQLGFDARLCWLGTNHIAYNYSTPSLAVDNHMICAWLYKGKKYFLDATETNIGLDEYAERIQGRQVMIENGGSYLLETIPVTTIDQNVQKEYVSLRLEQGSDFKGSVSLSYKGESRSDMLSRIQSIKKDNLQQSLITYLSNRNQDYAIADLHSGDLLGIDSLLKIEYTLHFKNAVSAFDKEIYADVDFRKEFDNFVIDVAQRKTDVLLPYKEHIITEVELDIPAGYQVKHLPAAFAVHHENADISISYTQQTNKLAYRKEIKINHTWLKKTGFEKWNSMINGLSEKYKEQIVFEKK